MTYMQSNHVFTVGIQELSFDETAFVGGGEIGDEFNEFDPYSDAMCARKAQRDQKPMSGEQQVPISAILTVGAALTGTTATAACLSPTVATPPGVSACAVASGVTAVLTLAAAGAALLGK